MASPDISPPDVVEGLLDLVAKSLVCAEVRGASAGYRLLDTTRAYAFEKLGKCGEMAVVARRHAEFYRDLFERAEAEWEMRPSSEWLSEYARQIDDVRVALDWAISPGGDASIGVALTAAAVPLWMHLSLLDECRGRAELALASLAAGMSRDARRDMKLNAALGASLTYNRGTTAPETSAAWTKALEIAESLDEAEYRLRSLRGLWFFHVASGQYRVALALAKRFHTLAASRSGPDDRLVGEQLIGVTQHYLGDQPGARRHLEHVFAEYAAVVHRPYTIRFPLDVRVQARVFLARVLWLQRFPDQAMRAAESSIEDARAANHAVSLGHALALGACRIALSWWAIWAEQNISWHCCLIIRQSGDLPSGTHGASPIRASSASKAAIPIPDCGCSMPASTKPAWRLPLSASLCSWNKKAEALSCAGRIAEGLAAIEAALERAEQTDERVSIAAMLRLKGELVLSQGAPGAAAAAEDQFRQALDWARREGALALELRAATSLAQLLRDQGRSADATALLQPVYGRFTEGFDTTDLTAARALLDSL